MTHLNTFWLITYKNIINELTVFSFSDEFMAVPMFVEYLFEYPTVLLVFRASDSLDKIFVVVFFFFVDWCRVVKLYVTYIDEYFVELMFGVIELA